MARPLLGWPWVALSAAPFCCWHRLFWRSERRILPTFGGRLCLALLALPFGFPLPPLLHGWMGGFWQSLMGLFPTTVAPLALAWVGVALLWVGLGRVASRPLALLNTFPPVVTAMQPRPSPRRGRGMLVSPPSPVHHGRRGVLLSLRLAHAQV